jgi:phosphopantetheinyl transferase
VTLLEDNRAILSYSALAGQISPAQLRACAAQLPYARRLRLRDSTQLASLAGIQLALRALGVLCGRRVLARELKFPPQGKPQLPGGPQFSISHTDHYVACVVACRGAVGLDIEEAAAGARLDLHALCDAEELRLVQSAGALAVWTAKEAALKALGRSVRDAASVRVRARHVICGQTQLHRQVLPRLAGEEGAGFCACIASAERLAPLIAQQVPLAELFAS